MKKSKLSLCLIALLVFTPRNVQAIGISSQCGILMEQQTGRVLYEKCADEPMYIASITKIMTALLAIEEGDLEGMVPITYEMASQVGSSLYLVPGDEARLADLIYGLMLRSGNDAAWAIASAVGADGDELDLEQFIEMMNIRAAQIGMTNTTFQNPSGLDESTYNISSARDMALLQRYAMNHPVFRQIAGTTQHRMTTKNGDVRLWRNKHRLVTGSYEYAIAGKTGFTKQARRTLVTSARKGDLELVVVTLKAGDDWNDHRSLFEYGFKNYELKQVLEVGEIHISESLRQTHGIDGRYFVNQPVFLTLKSDGSETVTTNLLFHEEAKGLEESGRLQVLLNGTVQEEVPVYELPEPELPREKSWFFRLFNRMTGGDDGS